MTSRIISLDGNMYQLPEGMSTKDVQGLMGFLVTMTKLDYEYLWGQGDSVYFPAHGATVRFEERALVTKAEAQALGKKAKEARDAKEAAEKAAKEATA
jgi:hypothetical protein